MTLIQHPVLANLEGAILHRVLYNNTNDDGYDNAIIVRIYIKINNIGHSIHREWNEENKQ